MNKCITISYLCNNSYNIFNIFLSNRFMLFNLNLECFEKYNKEVKYNIKPKCTAIQKDWK